MKRYPKETPTKLRMKARGKYKHGWPQGLVVHFTAGRFKKGDSDAIRTIEGGIKNGYLFSVLSTTGALYLPFDLDQHGYHAGTSSHPNLSGTVSKYLIGVEINNPGKLTKRKDGKFESWFKEVYEPSEVRYFEKSGTQQAGWYYPYTKAQEKTLVDFILWLKSENPDVFDLDLVLGHDEVSPGRKNDPGGALSMNMRDFREHLKKEWAKMSGAKKPVAEVKVPKEVALAYAALKKYKPNSKMRYIAEIDYSKFSGQNRLFVWDMKENVLTGYKVAHGEGSDKNHDGMADRFSNRSGSHQTCLGAFIAGKTYNGSNGYSLVLEGLEKTNNNAEDRYIVIHGADYVKQSNSKKQGRSWGCPAVDNDLNRKIIDQLKKGSILYSHFAGKTVL